MADDIVPEYLYKYRKLKNRDSFYKYDDKNNVVGFDDCGLDALSKGKIWFSHLDYLNDPYENQGDYDPSSLFYNLNDYLKTMPPNMPLKYKQMISRWKSDGLSDEDIIARIEKLQPMEDMLFFDIPRRMQEVEMEKQKIGILSLSNTKQNLLMWAYYADDHYGYCLEFSSKENHGIYCNGLSYNKNIGKVLYDSKYYTFADLNPYYHFDSLPNSEEKKLEFKKRLFCHKSREWAHEGEWRLFIDISERKENNNSTGALLPFPGKLTAIYCGARMSDAAIEALKDAVRKGNYGYMPKFKKAQLKKGVFGLDFETC